MMNQLLSLLFAFAAPAQDRGPAPAVRPTPDVAIVYILDVSGSMKDNKLAVTRDEVLAKAAQLEPSPSTPYIVILFESSIREVAVFNNGIEPLKAWFAKVEASGGTD